MSYINQAIDEKKDEDYSVHSFDEKEEILCVKKLI